MHVKPKQVEFYFFFLKLLYVEDKHKKYATFFPITAFEKSQSEIKIINVRCHKNYFVEITNNFSSNHIKVKNSKVTVNNLECKKRISYLQFIFPCYYMYSQKID